MLISATCAKDEPHGPDATTAVTWRLTLANHHQPQPLWDDSDKSWRHTSLEDFIKKVTQDLVDREQFMQENEARGYLEDEKKSRDRKYSTQNYSLPLFRADNERGFSRKYS